MSTNSTIADLIESMKSAQMDSTVQALIKEQRDELELASVAISLLLTKNSALTPPRLVACAVAIRAVLEVNCPEQYRDFYIQLCCSMIKEGKC